MKSLEQFLVELEEIARNGDVNGGTHWGPHAAYPYISDTADLHLQQLLATEKFKALDAYFTPPTLADQLTNVTNGSASGTSSQSYFDPTCGIGDLLISGARRLGPRSTLVETISRWGELLYGFDLIPELVRATKLRLLLAALEYNLPADDADLISVESDRLFPQIRAGDIYNVAVPGTDVVVLNPPFSTRLAPPDCAWAKGKVSQAALILERCLTELPANTQVNALLPDVLRSGSSYSRWRSRIEELATVESIEIVGKFSNKVSVEVFVIKLRVGSENSQSSGGEWWERSCAQAPTSLGDLFKLHVGAVVPHRHDQSGEDGPYLTVRDIVPWTLHNRVEKRRQFEGTRFSPPFVAIKRNSKAGENHRAVGAIVRGQEPVAVENHLIVLLPKDRKMKTCRKALTALKDKRTSEWLDRRIRCRHLTIASLRDLPVWDYEL